MGSIDTISTFKQAHQAELETIESKKAPVQTKIAELDQLASDIEAEKQAHAEQVGQAKYEEGYKAGNEAGYEEGLKAAEQAGGEDKLYSDAQMNEFIATAKEDAKKEAFAEAISIFESGRAQEHSVEQSVVEQLKSKAGQTV